MNRKSAAAFLWPRYWRSLDLVNEHARLTAWLRSNSPHPRFMQREEIHSYVAKGLTGSIDYLEFGVYQGASLRLWLGLNEHGSSRFFGFDSFRGVPATWGGLRPKSPGYLDMQGSVPEFDDERVTLVAGAFQDTLPGFLSTYEPRMPLVVHIDCDAYSGVLYVLTKLDPILGRGTLLMFDEFTFALDEWRAFREWCSAYDRQVEPVASAGTWYERFALKVTR